MNYSFFLLRREVITWVRRAISGLTSDLSSSTKEDMVVVRSVEGAEGDGCDGWLEVALAYVLGGSVIFFSGEFGNGWLAFTLKLFTLSLMLSCKKLLLAAGVLRRCSSL